MRHRKSFNHLGRKKAHRHAMLANMASSLIENKKIETTVAKAKALKMFVEPLITKSKEDTTHSRRVVFSELQNKNAVTELFREIALKVADRPGGYTRILKIGNRLGDNAEMCIIELVDYNENMLAAKETKAKSTRRRRSKKKPSTDTVTAKTEQAESETKEETVQEEKKAEELKVEEPKVDEAKAEEPKVEEPKAEEAKVEEPKVEEPKVEEATDEKSEVIEDPKEEVSKPKAEAEDTVEDNKDEKTEDPEK